jgi:hypothetical protein
MAIWKPTNGMEVEHMTGTTLLAQAATPARSAAPVSAYALLARMRRTAASELARHVPVGTRCVCCGEVWPCDRARLADLALS